MTDEPTMKVLDRLAERITYETGFPPLPSAKTYAEKLAQAINEDPLLQEKNQPFQMTAEEMLPLAEYLRRLIAEQMKDDLEEWDHLAREPTGEEHDVD